MVNFLYHKHISILSGIFYIPEHSKRFKRSIIPFMNTKTDDFGAAEITWDLSDLYRGIESEKLSEDRKEAIRKADEFSRKYHGRVGELSVDELKQALEDLEGIYDLIGRLGSFAHLIWSTNTNEAAYGKLMAEITELGSRLQQKLVFFEVEWLAIPEEKAQKYIDAPELKHYSHYLESSLRYKPYILEEKEEQILSAKSVTGRHAWVRFFDETMGAARFDLDGERLTEQQILSKLHESDRELRKRAAESITATFKNMTHPLSYVFNTVLADKHTDDRLRKYPQWITSRNLANEIEDKTVETLVNAVTGHYNLVQRYYQLKTRLLGYDKMYDYDRYAPLKKTETKFQWGQAREIVHNSYSSFHPEMGEIVQKFFNKRWIDAAQRPGKRSGAYAASTVPSVHPYVFLNYSGQVRDVQTLAHELGHGVHQYLSRRQGILQADTPLTTAETASVFGEMLVFQNLYKKLEDPAEKLALLIGKIDDTIATIFRQVSMNRFEDAIHKARREEGELTTDRFSELWHKTQHDLYGDAVTLSDNYRLWWCYIPHFLHTPGYVYAYAFGELLVLALYEQYQKKPDGFADRYIDLLSAGGSEWPDQLIANMGFDINSPDFWNQGLSVFEQMIEQAESLAEKR